ncbi:MAG: hypothetical protein OEZ51_01395 [Nitrospinota bacterium]|nr:hypothetical protein [Nitrospinota bacterium]
MNLYQLMKDYAHCRGLAPDSQLPAGELGKSLALFHNCLIESGMEYSDEITSRKISTGPESLTPAHLSRFVVGFLPFNSVSTRTETNEILFELFSFLSWMNKKDIHHGLAEIDYQNLVQTLTAAQERCLKLSHFLDNETGRILEEPPRILNTVNDIFQVIKIDGDYIYLHGHHQEDPIRVRLPNEILNLVRLHDNLDLVLGDTSERWVVLEAGQVFPEYQAG